MSQGRPLRLDEARLIIIPLLRHELDPNPRKVLTLDSRARELLRAATHEDVQLMYSISQEIFLASLEKHVAHSCKLSDDTLSADESSHREGGVDK